MKKYSDRLFLGVLALFLATVCAISLRDHRQQVSYYEQRTLAAFPALTAERLWNGDFFQDLEQYASDHVAGRTALLKTSAAVDLALHRPNVNQVVTDAEVLLPFHGFARWDLDYLAGQAEEMALQCAELQERVEAYGGAFCYVGLPLQSAYFAGDYPDYLDDRLWHTEAIRTTFSAAMEQAGVPFLDMHAEYARLGLPRDYYFETDHHFTLRGAFAAYRVLMEHLQAQGLLSSYLDEEDFLWETLPNPFLGSENRKLYGFRETADAVELAVPKTDIPFTRTNNGQLSSTIYTLPASETETVSYSVYMGGDIGETVIRTDRSDLPNTLIFGDSFTNAMEALLWTNFNETRSLDLRYYDETSLTAYVEACQPDIVICVRDETTYLSFTENGCFQ